MLFDQNIKTPSHEKIRLSDDSVARVLDDGSGVEIFQPVSVGTDTTLLDENDAIRLAAFLNRYFRERNQDIVRAEADRIKTSRLAKQARYEQRKATPREDV